MATDTHEPAMVVRVTANMAELKAAMQEGSEVIATTKTHMTAFANAFDGSRIISQANAVQAQIKALGGVTTLTANEQARANAILEDALQKYRALGQVAPPGMRELADATRRVTDTTDDATGSINTTTSAYRQFDGVLQSMGINITPFVKGIEDITSAAGKSVTEVGLLGSAGLALGAAYGGWKIGRMVADFFDLDEAIGTATARLLGYGDVAAETAAAKAEVLNGLLSWQANELRQVAQAGDENNAVLSRAALEWNFLAGEVEETAMEYTVMGDVVNGIIQSTGEAIDTQEAYRSELVFSTETIEKYHDGLEAAKQQVIDMAKAEADAATARAKQLAAMTQTRAVAPLSTSELEGIKGNPALTEAQRRQNVFTKLRELEDVEGRGPRGFFEGVTTQAQHTAAVAQQLLLAQLRMWADGQNRLPSFASGVTNFRGGHAIVGERGPELVRLPQGSNVLPTQSLGGTTLNLTLNVNGPVAGNLRDLAQMVGQEVMRTLRAQGFREPVGA